MDKWELAERFRKEAKRLREGGDETESDEGRTQEQMNDDAVIWECAAEELESFLD